MGHPIGGQGAVLKVRHTFSQAYTAVGNGAQFDSTTGHPTIARLGITQDGKPAVSFWSESGGWGGNVCEACWGFRLSCSGTRVGQWVEGLDRFLP